MKKSNWREELNAPKAVRKYALNEDGGLLTIPAGIALTKWVLGTLAVGGLGAAGYDFHEKMQKKIQKIYFYTYKFFIFFNKYFL